MHNPLVSIIIPTYNRAGLILETLESVKNQTYTHWECIIVDDGSTDDTAEVVHNYIQSDNRFQFHKRPHFHKPGGNGARNYGFTLAKGDYVNWFDSDDLMVESFLQCNLDEFEINNKLHLVSCYSSLFANSTNNIIGEYKQKGSSDSIIVDLIIGNMFFPTPCSVWKKKFLNGKDLFSEDLYRSQEAEFNFRRATENLNYFLIPNHLVLVRRDHVSINNTINYNTINSVYIYFDRIFEYLNHNDVETKYPKQKLINYVLYRKIIKIAEIRNFQNRINLINLKLFLKNILDVMFTNINPLVKSKIIIGLITILILNKGYVLINQQKMKLTDGN